MAKLILVDNYNRETVPDILLEENVTESDGQLKADKYNAKNKGSDYFARIVDDDYRLYRGMADLF